MIIFFLIIALLIPATMIGFGHHWQENPPKTINWAYGYRTTWSMKNKETWDFAHRYAGRVWLYAGLPLAVITVALVIAFRNTTVDVLERVVLIITYSQVVGILLPIPLTEIALRKIFDKNGKRKQNSDMQ